MEVKTARVGINEPQITAKIMDGEAIIIDLSSGIYYSLAGVGGLIWSGIEAGNSHDEILDTIVARHDVPRETALSDLMTLVNELHAAELVVPMPDSGTADAKPIEIADDTPKTAYEPPRLQRYEDMAELFALDPPLPDTLKAG